jgi:hypothetical protein
MADQFELADASVRETDLVDVQVQHPPVIDSPRGDCGLPLARSSGGSA